MQMKRKRTAAVTHVDKVKKIKVDPALQPPDVKRGKKKMVKKNKSDNPDPATSPDYPKPTFKPGNKQTFKSKNKPTPAGKATPKTPKTVESSEETVLTGKSLNAEKRVRKRPNKKKRAEKTKPAMEKIELPNTAEGMSCNWTQLQKMLGATATKKKSAPWRKHPQKSTTLRTETESAPDIWFDGVDDILIDSLKKSSELSQEDKKNPLIKKSQYTGLTKVVAMDCEMVGVGDGQDSILARVSIVNHDGHVLYDKYVKPREKVTDYRTFVSGVRAEDLVNAHDFDVVQKEVSALLQNRILVGHALHNDLKVLFLSHPRKDTRDTARFKPFRRLSGGRTPGLKKLAQELLGVEVQTGEHSSVQDAQAAMRIYTMHRKEWEKHIKEMRRGKGRKKRETTASSTDT